MTQMNYFRVAKQALHGDQPEPASAAAPIAAQTQSPEPDVTEPDVDLFRAAIGSKSKYKLTCAELDALPQVGMGKYKLTLTAERQGLDARLWLETLKDAIRDHLHLDYSLTRQQARALVHSNELLIEANQQVGVLEMAQRINDTLTTS
jgi:hypothetical protein